MWAHTLHKFVYTVALHLSVMVLGLQNGTDDNKQFSGEASSDATSQGQKKTSSWLVCSSFA